MRGYKFLLQGCRGKQILLHCALAMFSPTSGEATFLPLGFFWTSNSCPDNLFITLNQGCTINRGENSWIRIQDNNYAKKKLRKPIKKNLFYLWTLLTPEETETSDGPYLGKFAHVFLTHGVQRPLDTKMADNSSPGSVGLPRWRAN